MEGTARSSSLMILLTLFIMSEISTHPIQERLPIALLLATNSGFVDAYTFQYHGERFASLQTGNIIQAGISLARGQFNYASSFLLPILFFLLGAAFNNIIKHQFKARKLSTQQHSLIIEIIGISLVVFIRTQISSTVFITLLSFFLAIQLDAFPKVQGLPFTSVMSTGNLRNVGANLITYFYTKNRTALQNASLFSLIILAFLFGAFISALLSTYLKHFTLLGSSVILMTIFGLLFDYSKK
nr:YoaK family protein [Leuconostoc gasicomitatum]